LNDACWEWRGNKDKDGYGLLSFRGKMFKGCARCGANIAWTNIVRPARLPFLWEQILLQSGTYLCGQLRPKQRRQAKSWNASGWRKNCVGQAQWWRCKGYSAVICERCRIGAAIWCFACGCIVGAGTKNFGSMCC